VREAPSQPSAAWGAHESGFVRMTCGSGTEISVALDLKSFPPQGGDTAASFGFQTTDSDAGEGLGPPLP
jgi:hypothetical protein